MKKLLWTSAMALTAVACLTACDESTSGASNAIASYKAETALPDTCEMEVAKAGDTYFACFDNKWVEVTDSATVEEFKEGLDEEELKKKLEELEEKLEEAMAAAKKPSSSSKKVESSAEVDEGGDEPESSASEEECTGRRCKTGNSSSSKKSSGGNGGSGSGEGGEGSSPSSAESSSPSSAESSSPSSAESSSPSSAESSSPSSAESSSPSSAESSSPSSAESSSPSSAESSSPSSASSSSVSKCGGVVYDPETQSCVSNVVKDKCGSKLYTHQKYWACVDENYYYADLTDEDFLIVIDKRDDNAYRVLMGPDEVVWMAENLRYNNGNTTCYSGDNSGCSLYGRGYTWTDAAGSVCPVGWHTASNAEWNGLISAMADYLSVSKQEAITALRSKTGWPNADGTDDIGFNMKPISLRGDVAGGSLSYAYYRTSTEGSGSMGGHADFYDNRSYYLSDGDNVSRHGVVRCVMDDATLTKLEKAFK